MRKVRTLVITFFFGAGMLLSGCSPVGEDAEDPAATTEQQAPEEPVASEEPSVAEEETADTEPTAEEGSGTPAFSSPVGERQGVVTIGETTWEFEMEIACGARFGAITFMGQNSDGSANIAGGVSDYEDDAGFEIKVVDGPEWELQPGSSYVIEDRTVRGTGDFHNERNPGETASGEFEITC